MKITLILIMFSGLFAQDFDRDVNDIDQMKGKRKQRMEMMMVWRLTEDLELTPDQADSFFPRFRQHREEMEDLKKMTKVLGKEMKEKLRKDEEISKADITATVNKINDLKKQVIDLETKFLLGMDNLLTPKQMANLGIFKQKMMRELRGELKEHGKKKKHGMKGMKGKRGSKKMRRGY